MKQKAKHSATFWVFLAPVLVALTLVVLVPFALGIFYSFTDWSSSAKAGGIRYVGLLNYQKSLSDPRFLYSFGITTIYSLVCVFSMNILAFLLALLVSSKLRGRNVYRAGFFVPNLIGGLVLGYVWQFIFNAAVPALGAALRFEALTRPENLLLADHVGALAAMIIVSTWQYAGYIMMIYLAAIESVPPELLEAAQIDGAEAFQRLRHITLPMVAQAFTVTLFLTLINSFKQFDINVSLTAGGPSTMFGGKAIKGTQLLALNIYDTAFTGSDLAQGQARAFLFFVVLVMVSVFQVRLSKKREIEL
ncbi:MAG: sugar ABC transporter permease [Spirochaetaceae bacterium]|nr:sugar ABC transporter permease [Spirochaetaceae bacterium]